VRSASPTLAVGRPAASPAPVVVGGRPVVPGPLVHRVVPAPVVRVRDPRDRVSSPMPPARPARPVVAPRAVVPVVTPRPLPVVIVAFPPPARHRVPAPLLRPVSLSGPAPLTPGGTPAVLSSASAAAGVGAVLVAAAVAVLAALILLLCVRSAPWRPTLFVSPLERPG
jgi:hypothetical protein